MDTDLHDQIGSLALHVETLKRELAESRESGSKLATATSTFRRAAGIDDGKTMHSTDELLDMFWAAVEKQDREHASLRKALERLLGCPPNCREDSYPGCAWCMSPTAFLIEQAMAKTPPSDRTICAACNGSEYVMRATQALRSLVIDYHGGNKMHRGIEEAETLLAEFGKGVVNAGSNGNG